ncbi:BsuPI-related putative proteinase inhibitor [Evansella halocellulosilytica]|uniref:BsuPI-related putative proteinase inhibitor n=1 Tax=Evansella halocellulosilytica TaxID=2011013 RepID=UPI000BB71E24|nr:BsuPI-related putative proteinase inhibitor [Evansella halocellulosilytica]
MTRAKFLLCCMLSSILFISACGTGESPTDSELDDHGSGAENGVDEEEATEVVYEDLVFDLDASIENNRVNVQMALKNDGDSQKTVDFSSGQQFEVIISADGEQLYKFSEGRMFTQAFITEKIEPGESLTFEDVWESDAIAKFESLDVKAEILVYSIDGKEVSDTPFEQTISIQ